MAEGPWPSAWEALVRANVAADRIARTAPNRCTRFLPIGSSPTVHRVRAHSLGLFAVMVTGARGGPSSVCLRGRAMRVLDWRRARFRGRLQKDEVGWSVLGSVELCRGRTEGPCASKDARVADFPAPPGKRQHRRPALDGRAAPRISELIMEHVAGTPQEKLVWLQEQKTAGKLDGDDPDEIAEAEALLAMLARLVGSKGGNKKDTSTSCLMRDSRDLPRE